MRWKAWLLAICGLFAVASGRQAAAAEPGYPVLRGSQTYEVGPPSYRDWSGLYIGGQVGAAASGVDFSSGVSQLVANLLRFTTVEDEFQPSQWANLPRQSVTRVSYGAFIGYNVQFEDTIIGIEANYNRTNARMSSGDTVARTVTTSDGYANAVTVSGTGSIHLTDYGTLRLRGGWMYNGFLPYVFAGAAFGRATVMRSASVSIVGTDADPGCVGPPDVCLPPFAFAASQTENKVGAIAYGWTAGAGADWALFGNVFLRGEFEYVGFGQLNGATINIATVRAGAGIKF
jgi:opacity protein-like surface antigen